MSILAVTGGLITYLRLTLFIPHTERLTAAARSDGVRIMDCEPTTHAGFLKVNFKTVQIAHTFLAYNDFDSFDVHKDIVFALLIIKPHAI
ncbi:hypothetical protein D3C76_1724880 [compost metagenome]